MTAVISVTPVHVLCKKSKCRELVIVPEPIAGSYKCPCHWTKLKWDYQFTLPSLPSDWISYPGAGQLQTNVTGLRNTTQLSSTCRKGRTWAPAFESLQTEIVSSCSRHPSKYRRGFTDNLNFLSLLLTFSEVHNWFPALKRTQIHSLLTDCLHFYGLHFYFIIFNFLLPTLEWVLESQYKTYSGLLF